MIDFLVNFSNKLIELFPFVQSLELNFSNFELFQFSIFITFGKLKVKYKDYGSG